MHAEKKRKGVVEGDHLGVECRGSVVRGKEWQVLIPEMINTNKKNILSEPRGKDGVVV